jgi:citronellol/citronellal dehydrogenase
MCVVGMAEEFRGEGIAVNALWPRHGIATAATAMLGEVMGFGGEDFLRRCRKPEIMADAAYLILTSDARQTSGNFFIDDEVLAAAGITDLAPYALGPEDGLFPDFFVG